MRAWWQHTAGLLLMHGRQCGCVVAMCMPFQVCIGIAYGPYTAALQGDNGSPLVWKGPGGDVAVGVATWTGCSFEYPSVFADVAAASDWIRNAIQVGGAA